MPRTQYDVHNVFSSLKSRSFNTHAEAVRFLKEQDSPRSWVYMEFTFEGVRMVDQFSMRGDDYLDGQDVAPALGYQNT